MRTIKLRYKILGALALSLFVLLFFLSTLIKNYAVKHSQELIGRKITLKELHFNYFKVAVRAKEFVMFETNQTDKFISFGELYINFDPLALFSNEYSFSQITLKTPRVFVSQNKEIFNFDDLTKSSNDTTKVTENADTVSTAFRFTVKNLQLQKGLVVYEDKQIGNHIELDDLNLDIPLISWDSQQSNMGINFRLGKKGEVEISAEVDNQNKRYTILLNTTTISLSLINDYLKDYLAISSFDGLLSSKIKIKGEFEQVTNLTVSGNVTVDSLLINDKQNELLMSIGKVETNINSAELSTSRFNISSITVTNPTINASLYRDMSNFERALQPLFKSDSLAAQTDSVEIDSTKQTQVTYKVDTIRVKNGTIMFTDNTLNRPFKYDLTEFNLSVSSLTQSAQKVPVAFSVVTNRDGKITGNMNLNMVNTSNLSVIMNIKRLGLISFSPYSEYFIASPITQGWFNYNLSLEMTPKKLINNNSIRFEELEFGKKTKDSTSVKVPIKLALYILKDANDIIAFDLPVEGNPSEPKFSYKKIVWKTLGNFLVKTAAAPFNALSGLAGSNPEDLEKMPFEYAQSKLDEKQTKTLSNIALIMQKKPNLIFRFVQFTNLANEKNYIATLRAKKDYVLSVSDSPTDTARVNKQVANLSSNDKNFMDYLRTREPLTDSIGIEPACLRLYSSTEIEAELSSIIAKRNNIVQAFLLNSQGIKPEMLEVTTADLKNVPSELKFPHFKIEVTVQ